MVTPNFLAGTTLSAAQLQLLATQDTYTPAIVSDTTDPTYGTGATRAGFIWLTGNKVDVWGTIAFGTGMTNGSGSWQFTLPSAYPIDAGWYDTAIGTGRQVQVSPSFDVGGICTANVAANRFWMRNSSDDTLVTAITPWAWDVGDSINWHVTYLTDFGV